MKQQIIELCLREYGTDFDTLSSTSRIRDVAECRQMIVKVLRDVLGLGYAELGDILGRSHVGALQAYRVMDNKLSVPAYRHTRSRYRNILNAINQSKL